MAITVHSTDLGKRVVLLERYWDYLICDEFVQEHKGTIERLYSGLIWIKFDGNSYNSGVEYNDPGLFWDSQTVKLGEVK